MATTRIMPLHIGKGRSVGTAVSDILEYVKDTEKTDQGRLVTCFQCNPEIADAEFCFSKRRYQTSTGRKQENDVIAYHVRQSFKPGEITPEEANRLGCEFAERFLKGNHAYIVCTHIDKSTFTITSSGTPPRSPATGNFATFGAAPRLSVILAI